MPHIYISHQHNDHKFALFLEQKLRLWGFDVWLDPNPRAGEDWSPELDRAIDDSLAVCVILTPETAIHCPDVKAGA